MQITKQKIVDNAYFIIFIVISVLTAGFLLHFMYAYDPGYSWNITIHHQSGPTENRTLDGRLVPSEVSDLRPVIVMMENHIDSRPVSGLEKASIIYETIVEGDITRFLAIFDPEAKATKIGPVRSARPFFVEIAEEWNGVYYHAGGSEQALQMIRSGSLENVNEISADGIYFWRDTNRTPPHNLYTSIDQINRAIVAKDYATSTEYLTWKHKNQKRKVGEEAAEVKINFSSDSDYQVRYVYDERDNNYTRYQNNKIHKTTSGIILKANNIIKQYVDHEIIDYYGRLSIDLDSGGEAEIFQDGLMIEARWEKSNGRTRFFDTEDNEILLNIGVTWVELVFNK